MTSRFTRLRKIIGKRPVGPGSHKSVSRPGSARHARERFAAVRLPPLAMCCQDPVALPIVVAPLRFPSDAVANFARELVERNCVASEAGIAHCFARDGDVRLNRQTSSECGSQSMLRVHANLRPHRPFPSIGTRDCASEIADCTSVQVRHFVGGEPHPSSSRAICATRSRIALVTAASSASIRATLFLTSERSLYFFSGRCRRRRRRAVFGRTRSSATSDHPYPISRERSHMELHSPNGDPERRRNLFCAEALC